MRGVKEVALIDQALLGSADARKLDEFAPSLQQVYAKPATLRAQGRESLPIYGPVDLFEAMTGSGARASRMQRYKGLGEMNPDSSGKPRSTPMCARCCR